MADLTVNDVIVEYKSTSDAFVLGKSALNDLSIANRADKLYYGARNFAKDIYVVRHAKNQSSLRFIQEKALIDSVCIAAPDVLIVNQAISKLKSEGGDMPVAFLYHYINGSQSPVQIDVQKLLNDNPEVRKKLITIIGYQEKGVSVLASKYMEFGRIPIDYTEFTKSWGLSIGRINFLWSRKQGGIEISIKEKKYYWKPDQEIKDMRQDECIHQVMERLKGIGAKDFDMKGTNPLYINNSEAPYFNNSEMRLY